MFNVESIITLQTTVFVVITLDMEMSFLNDCSLTCLHDSFCAIHILPNLSEMQERPLLPVYRICPSIFIIHYF